MKLVAILLVVLTSAAAHADGSGSAASSGSDAPPAMSADRQACTAAMNADPSFVKAILDVAIHDPKFTKLIMEVGDKEAADRRLAATEAEHLDAAKHIAKDEQHVIAAYAAMWIIAALFVVFLWRRQQALKAEIEQLRKDLEKEAADQKDPKKDAK